VTSLIDTWLLVRDLEQDGERNRTLVILKSRGMAHSNQVREFVLSTSGVELREAYRGAQGVLIGSARIEQQARDREHETRRVAKLKRVQTALAARQESIEAEIATLRPPRTARPGKRAASPNGARHVR